MDWVTNRWMAWTPLVTEPFPPSVANKPPKADEDRLVEELEHLGTNVLKGSWQHEEIFTSFLQCLYLSVKAEFNNSRVLSTEKELVRRFYQDVTPKIIGFQLSEQSWRWIHQQQLFFYDSYNGNGRKAYYNDEGILLCLALLADLSVFSLHSMHEGDVEDDNRLGNTVSVLRTLSEALDKQSLFQRHHEQRDLPPFVQYNPHLFTKTQISDVDLDAESSGGQKYDGFCVCLKQQKRTSTKQPYYISCKCRNCQPPESHRWITILLEYFGNNVVCGINGFRELRRVLETVRQPEKVQLEVMEVSLHFISMAVEFLKDEVACPFLGPCIDILRYISQLGGHVPNTNSVGLTVLILKHLKAIFSRLLSPKIAERMIEEAQKRMQEQVLVSLMSRMGPCATEVDDDTPPPESCRASQTSSYDQPLFKFSARRISETGVRSSVKKTWCRSPLYKRSDSSVSQPRKVQVCSTSTI